jgi:hypothetical protein
MSFVIAAVYAAIASDFPLVKSLGKFAATESTEFSVISDFVLGKKDSLTVSSFP